MSVDVNVIDNSGEVLREIEQKKQSALTAVGITAEAYAKLLTPVDTGRLRSSITHAVKDDDVYIGSNLQYAKWIERGTGIFAEDDNGNPNGEGRQSPWQYYDRNGKAHWTRGVKAHHMLKKAASEHTEEYKAIIKRIMSK